VNIMSTPDHPPASSRSLSDLPEAADARDAHASPASDVRLTAALSAKELRAFLARTDTQNRIREVVVARVGKNAPRAVIDELVQEANVEMLESRSLPRSLATARAWVSAIASRAIVHRVLRDAAHAKWLVRGVEVEELASEPDEAPGPVAPEWMLTAWLAPLVAHEPRHQETYELLLYKAATGKTHAQVAADHGMTEGALKSRIRELKAKYEPRWRRRQRMFLLLLVFCVGVAAVLAWLVFRPAVPDIGPDDEPMPRPTATATASAPAPFDQALPTAPFNGKPALPPRRP
jgi:DNA-directed RNA polymerase specialized sigma24 family protein